VGCTYADRRLISLPEWLRNDKMKVYGDHRVVEASSGSSSSDSIGSLFGR